MISNEAPLGADTHEIPDRCQSCPNIGELVVQLAKLSDERERRRDGRENFPSLSVIEQVTDKMRQAWPTHSEEFIQEQVQAELAALQGSDEFSRWVMDVERRLIEIENEYAKTQREIEERLRNCPHEGCGLDSPESPR